MCLHHFKYSITFLPLMVNLSPAFSTSTSLIHAFFRTSFTIILSRKLNQHLFSVLPTYCSMQFIFSFLPHTYIPIKLWYFAYTSITVVGTHKDHCILLVSISIYVYYVCINTALLPLSPFFPLWSLSSFLPGLLFPIYKVVIPSLSFTHSTPLIFFIVYLIHSSFWSSWFYLSLKFLLEFSVQFSPTFLSFCTTYLFLIIHPLFTICLSPWIPLMPPCSSFCLFLKNQLPSFFW